MIFVDILVKEIPLAKHGMLCTLREPCHFRKSFEKNLICVANLFLLVSFLFLTPAK